MTPSPSTTLHEPLPSESISHRSRGLAAYRQYAVYSWPWWWRRSVLFGAFAAFFAGLAGLPAGMVHHDWMAAATIGALSTLGFGTMACAGPLLATLVRHARRPIALERWLVVAAIAAGVIASAYGDGWASARIDATLRAIPTYVPLPAPPARAPIAVLLGNLVACALYFVLGGGLALRAYFSEHRRHAEAIEARRLALERLQHQRTGLRLAVLQAQVEPHFLFNTLASLRSLVEIDPHRATAMIDALVAYLRGTIPQLRDDASNGDSTLARQFALCEAYLRVIAVRMGDRLHVRVAVPEDLRDEPFPPLMLISLVENAVKHGIERKRGAGTIGLQASRDAATSTLYVTVEDDGPGFDAHAAGGGIGLANIREQLRSRYGDAARLDLVARPDGGVRATITLPRATMPS